MIDINGLLIIDQYRKLLGVRRAKACSSRGRFTNRPYGWACVFLSRAGLARCSESQDWTGPSVRVLAAGLELVLV